MASYGKVGPNDEDDEDLKDRQGGDDSTSLWLIVLVALVCLGGAFGVTAMLVGGSKSVDLEALEARSESSRGPRTQEAQSVAHADHKNSDLA